MSSTQARRGTLSAAGSLFFAVALAALATAQDPVPTTYPAPPTLCVAFDVHAGTVQHLAVAPAAEGHAVVQVELGGAVQNLVLQPHDVRAADFQLLVADANGVHTVPTPPSVTWRGMVLADPASWVAATIVGQSVTALVHMGDGAEWAIQPVGDVQPRVGPAAHMVYRTADNAPLPWTCGVQGSLSGPLPTPIGTDVTYICQIACEADVQYYQQNGSNVTATQNDVTGIINAMAAIYLADMQINFTISSLLVNTTSPGPYSSSNPGTLLGQFQANWINNHGGITRDLAHLFTGRNMAAASGTGTIGIAFLSGLCSTVTGYGVSQSRWTTNFTRRVAVTAHEVGHNFSAGHCDAVAPCHIMCSGVGGCANVQTSFSQNERNAILGFAQVSPCLQVVSSVPTLATAAPSTVGAFQPGSLTLTGTGFLGTTSVQVGSTVMTSGFTVASDTSMSVILPAPTALGAVAVQVTNIAGTSNARTITYAATSPCAMTVSPAVLGGQTLTWNFGGQPNNVWALLVGGFNTTTPVQGWPVLDGYTLLSVGLLNSTVGLGNNATLVPAGTFGGITFYSQMVELLVGAPELTIVSTSTLRSTFVVN